MVSSKTKPPREPPSEESVIAPASEHETLDECLKEMRPCDQAAETVPEEGKYIFPALITYAVPGLYSAIQGTPVALAATSAVMATASIAVVTYLQETMVKGYDFELLRSFFKKPEPGKEPLQKAPEGGDESGKVAYAFLQKMKNYVSNELAEIFRWNGYRAKEEEQATIYR